jgi:pimeloyl-ACP methyl ester carboxylesterase
MTEAGEDIYGRRLPAVVLVHGAWTDGSCWREIIAILQRRGILTAAVQMALESLNHDVDLVLRIVRRMHAPVLLVGHGYGGTVITQAGNHADVRGLLYVAAFAPDIGQSTAEAYEEHAATTFMGRAQIEDGRAYLTPEAFRDYFAHDLPVVESRVLASVQSAITIAAVREKIVSAAWHSRPSWYALTAEDRMLDPRIQREILCRIQATPLTIQSGHVPFLSHPRETASAVIQVAEAIAVNQ